MVIAATFSNATYERLPLEEDEETGGSGQNQLPDASSGGSPPGIGNNTGGHHQQPGMPDPSSLAIYNLPPNLMPNGGHMNHDAYANWAQARPPY
jgi:hypothetical protein